jgi:hypothetical protein
MAESLRPQSSLLSKQIKLIYSSLKKIDSDFLGATSDFLARLVKVGSSIGYATKEFKEAESA